MLSRAYPKTAKEVLAAGTVLNGQKVLDGFLDSGIRLAGDRVESILGVGESAIISDPHQ